VVGVAVWGLLSGTVEGKGIGFVAGFSLCEEGAVQAGRFF